MPVRRVRPQADPLTAWRGPGYGKKVFQFPTAIRTFQIKWCWDKWEIIWEKITLGPFSHHAQNKCARSEV